MLLLHSLQRSLRQSYWRSFIFTHSALNWLHVSLLSSNPSHPSSSVWFVAAASAFNKCTLAIKLGQVVYPMVIDVVVLAMLVYVAATYPPL